MKIADTHCHLSFANFDADRSEIIAKDLEAGVQFSLQIGCDEISSLASLKLAKNHDFMFASLGLHPCEVAGLIKGEPNKYPLQGFENHQQINQNLSDFFTWLDNLIDKNKEQVLALGETGFDRYYDNSEQSFIWQQDSFDRHLKLCDKYNLPVVIHTRQARQETIDFLDEKLPKFPRKIAGVVHCFSEDPDFAELCWKKWNLHLGIGGVSTYKNTEQVREAIRRTPIEWLLTETDAPFLPSQNRRKQGLKRSESSHIIDIIQLIAELKKISVEKTAEQLWKNAQSLFKF